MKKLSRSMNWASLGIVVLFATLKYLNSLPLDSTSALMVAALLAGVSAQAEPLIGAKKNELE